MKIDDERPIFIQIAESIEDGILSGAFVAESQIPSTTEIAVTYKINPATALKGMTILVNEGILYKKRGLGMFVCEGADEKVKKKRKQQFFEHYIVSCVSEAQKLGLSKQEIIDLILKMK